MASQSRDEPHDESARADGGAKGSEPDNGEAQEPAVSQDTDAATAGDAEEGPEAESLLVEDEELIEMLEQLNETLDSARMALSEHPNISGLAASAAAAAPEPPDALASEPPRQSLARPMLAAALGMCLGAGGLAMLWPVWTARQAAGLQAKPAGDSPRETRLARSMRAASPAGDAIAAVPLPEPRPVLKAIRERVPQLAEPTAIAFAINPDAGVPMTDVAAASAVAPAMQAELLDKPDFEEKDASNSMPVPDRGPAVAVLPEKPAQLPALTPEEEAALISRGNDFLDNGDFASARLMFEHAAARGSAEALYALARSYDPRFLKEREAVGIRPDRALALELYARAAEKGHDQADAMASELEKVTAR